MSKDKLSKGWGSDKIFPQTEQLFIYKVIIDEEYWFYHLALRPCKSDSFKSDACFFISD